MRYAHERPPACVSRSACLPCWPQEDVELWLTHVNDLSTHPKCRVRHGRRRQQQPACAALLCLNSASAVPRALAGWRYGAHCSPLTPLASLLRGPQVRAKMSRQPDNRRLRVYIYQVFSKDSLSSSLLAGTWTRKSPDTNQEEVVAVDLRFVFSFLDGFEGSPFMQAVDRCRGWTNKEGQQPGCLPAAGCCGGMQFGGDPAQQPVAASAHVGPTSPACA